MAVIIVPALNQVYIILIILIVILARAIVIS
jgi:hypothetical protein